MKTSLCILRRGRPVAEGGWACRAGTCAGSPAAPGSHSQQECGRAPARNHTPDHRKGPCQQLFYVPTVKAGNFVNGVLFRHHSVKTLGASAWLSLTATDFVQKQSRHDVIFSFEVDSYKI